MTQQEVVTEKIKEFVKELNGRFNDQISDQTLEKYLYHSFWNEYVLRDEIQRGDNQKIRASELAQYSNAILLFTAICQGEDTQLSIKNTDSLLFQFQSKFESVFLIGNLKNQYNPMTFKIGKVATIAKFTTICEKSSVPEEHFWEEVKKEVFKEVQSKVLDNYVNSGISFSDNSEAIQHISKSHEEAFNLVSSHIKGFNEVIIGDKWFCLDF